MSELKNLPVSDRLLLAAETALADSAYANSSRELRKAWVIGWLIQQLAAEYQTSYDLRRRIDTVLHSRNRWVIAKDPAVRAVQILHIQYQLGPRCTSLEKTIDNRGSRLYNNYYVGPLAHVG